MPAAIVAQGIRKRYDNRAVVDDLDLEIAEGEFFGLLGANGAGKTTTIHILSTLVRPDAGRAQVAGYDTCLAPVQVRAAIGLVFQESALDRNLTVAENLRFAGALYGMEPAQVRRRSEELLQLFGLEQRRDDTVSKLSGGMRRALDIMRGLLHRPRVLFLDEPTLGLDVINRRSIWAFLAQLRRESGLTILLTTHYLEEAGACDRVAFLRAGRLREQGQPAAMIRALGDYILEIVSTDAERHERLLSAQLGRPVRHGERLLFRVRGDAADISALQARLHHEVESLQLRRPDLNDVYVWHNSEPEAVP